MKIIVAGGVAESLFGFRGELMRRMVALGHEVLAIAGNEHAGTTNALAALGIRFATYPLGRTGTGPLEDLATCRALARLFRTERPELVLAYTVKPVVWGGIAARLSGVPRFVALITGTGEQFVAASADGGARFALRSRLVPTVVTGLYRLALARAEAVIFQNADDRALFLGRGLIRAAQAHRVDGSGVDVAGFAERPLPDGPLTFLMIARLRPAKGVREYAAAARLVRERRPGTRFRLITEPETGAGAIPRSEVEGWAAEGVVEWLGSLDDVRPALAACHVYVLPSYYGEGVPRTILEAMATGRPVLTTDNVGCRDAVEHGSNGLLVPPRDVRALADAAVRLIDDEPARRAMGRAGRALAESRYDVHRVNDALLDVLGLPTRDERHPVKTRE